MQNYSKSSISLSGTARNLRAVEGGINEASHSAFMALLLNTIYISSPGPSKHNANNVFYQVTLHSLMASTNRQLQGSLL